MECGQVELMLRFYSRRHAEALAEASQEAYPDSAFERFALS
jgi:hypothetical protein